MLQKLKNRQAQKGFTLIELLIVIVIIAILAAIAISAFAGAQAKARDTQRKSDIETVQGALELFYANEGHYPFTASTTTLDNVEADAFIDPTAEANSFGTDAATDGQYQYAPAGTDCAEATPENCQSYTLGYYSEQENEAKTTVNVSGD